MEIAAVVFFSYLSGSIPFGLIITKIFSNNKVSIKRVLQNPHKNKKRSSIVIITHKSKDGYIQKTLKTLAKKSYIIQKPKIIRIENG